jgi:carbonic anhydrase/acetyltransferase-like protein (isoleucine patch superfamily)
MSVPSYPYGDRSPTIDPTAYVAPGARVVGDVTLGPRASVWFNAVLRGDSDAVRLGAESNVQDGSVLHTDGGSPCLIGERCTIGHAAVVHGCTIGGGCLIGMGSIVLSGASIGDESIVAAGALIPEGRSYPARSLLVGSPARRLRSVTDEDVERLIVPGVRHYVEFAEIYRRSIPD